MTFIYKYTHKQLLRATAIILVFIFNIMYLFGQKIPDPPQIQFVSVNPITGIVHINWINSSSPHLKMYYIVQRRDDYANAGWGGNGLPYADSVIYDPSVTSASFSYDSVKIKPVWFFMFAVDSFGEQSNFPASHRTVYLSCTYDSCNSVIHLNWNPYVGWGNNLSNYAIFENLNGNWQKLIDSIPVNENEFNVYGISNQVHSYYILAANSDGITTSTSYKDSIYIKPNGLPSSIQGISSDYNNGNVVDLKFLIESNTQAAKYILFKSSKINGSFQPEVNLTLTSSGNGTVDIVDTANNTAYYKLYPLTRCDSIAVIPNLITAIVPKVSINANVADISWPSYEGWYMGVKQYDIYRAIGDGPPENIQSVSFNQATQYNDNLTTLIGQNNKGNLCYYVVAVSNPDSTGNIYSSKSSTVCADMASDIFIPNAFTPNGDGINDEFIVSFAFEPLEFKMTIYNRSGGELFETDNPHQGWNGKLKGGENAPEGIYVYFISYTSDNGEKIYKKGSFSLIYP